MEGYKRARRKRENRPVTERNKNTRKKNLALNRGSAEGDSHVRVRSKKVQRS